MSLNRYTAVMCMICSGRHHYTAVLFKDNEGYLLRMGAKFKVQSSGVRTYYHYQHSSSMKYS